MADRYWWFAEWRIFLVEAENTALRESLGLPATQPITRPNPTSTAPEGRPEDDPEDGDD